MRCPTLPRRPRERRGGGPFHLEHPMGGYPAVRSPACPNERTVSIGSRLRGDDSCGCCRHAHQTIFAVSPSRKLESLYLSRRVSASCRHVDQRGISRPIFCLTCSSARRAGLRFWHPRAAPRTAFGFNSPSGSASGTTAASSTAGWVIPTFGYFCFLCLFEPRTATSQMP